MYVQLVSTVCFCLLYNCCGCNVQSHMNGNKMKMKLKMSESCVFCNDINDESDSNFNSRKNIFVLCKM